jgi:hypothetical protein
MSDTTTRKIAELNDLCRTAMGVAGKLFQTAGINALPLADQSAIRERPRHEHSPAIGTAIDTIADDHPKAVMKRYVIEIETPHDTGPHWPYN